MKIPALKEGEIKRCYLMREVDGEEVRIELAPLIENFVWNKKMLPRYIGIGGIPKKYEIVGEFLEMPESIFEKFHHRPYENAERLIEEFEKYGWKNRKQEKGVIQKLKSKIFSTGDYKNNTPKLYPAN